MIEGKPWYKRMLIFVLLVSIPLILIFGAKLYLVVNLLLGNDVIIKLDVNQDVFSLMHGEEKNVVFKASAITNPFCAAKCTSVFFDVSNNKTINNGTLVLIPGIPTNREFAISSPDTGRGQRLYEFSMSCASTKTTLCHTTEIPTIRNILVTVNYDLNEEDKRLRNETSSELDKFSYELNRMNNTLTSLKQTNSSQYDIDSKMRTLDVLETELDGLSDVWNNEEYQSLATSLNTFKEKVNNLDNEVSSINQDIMKFASDHNKEVDDLIKKETLDKELKLDTEYDALCSIRNDCRTHPSIAERSMENTFNLDSACKDIDDIRTYYSNINSSLTGSSNDPEFLDNISTIVKNIKKDITNKYLDDVPSNAINSELIKSLLTKTIISESASYSGVSDDLSLELVRQRPQRCNVTIPDKISLPGIQEAKSDLKLNEKPEQCCIYGECRECCLTKDCRDDPETYPVIFIHGHAFTNVISAEYSLDAFNKLQKKLENEGYINAGVVSLYTEKENQAKWGKAWRPVDIKASYYFDVFKEPENYVVVQTNSENIDTYAIRLRDLIDTVNFNTGRPKVIIVAHSMGGLVARRYMQIFGSDKVAKLIMISTPNKGIIGSPLGYCPYIGEKLECRDMSSDSLLLNKLNRDALPSVPIYNIVGTGCDMDKGIGDGVVLTENALLEGANNTIIEGKCEGLDVLHTSMLVNIERYPQVYDTILKALKS